MVQEGDKVQDTNGKTWTITHTNGNLAYYNQTIPIGGGAHESNCFIARFNTGGTATTYNKNMTLVD